MKALEDMNEVELRHLTNLICNMMADAIPPNCGFAVLFWPCGQNGISQYGSNCRREDMVKALREAADRLESRTDVPR
jgi:hypothetical protein